MYEPQKNESNVQQEPKIKNPEHAEYKDVFWGVLFVLQILTVIGLACSLYDHFILLVTIILS